MATKENDRVFRRQLENTVVNNERFFEDAFEPGAPEIAWMPTPNVRVMAFAMLSHPHLGEASL